MRLLRSERLSAVVLLVAAVLGLLIANTITDPALGLRDAHVDLPLIGVDLSAGHWVSDGLLAVFFFIVAVELRRELVVGELASFGRAIVPAVAAIGGVVVPALLYLAFTLGTGYENGWPIPTATDIAFALGILAIFGRGLPTHVRVFLMALAVLDDLVAILIIAFFFTSDVDFAAVGFAAISATLFGTLSRLMRPRSPWMLRRRPHWPVIAALVVLALLTWYFTLQSGVHATIAGVVLGLVMSRRPAGRTAHVLEPVSNGVILPLFAFTAAMVVIPSIPVSEISPVFWAILVALPVGKLIGITGAGAIGSAIMRSRRSTSIMAFGDLVAVAALGGVGFTVALLMNELAFRGDHATADEGTLAVLFGSTVAIVLGSIVVSLRARRYRRLRQGLQASQEQTPGRSPSAGG